VVEEEEDYLLVLLVVQEAELVQNKEQEQNQEVQAQLIKVMLVEVDNMFTQFGKVLEVVAVLVVLELMVLNLTEEEMVVLVWLQQ
jgi:hypothetical protein